jgi:periplasmic protein TonB
MKSGTCFAAICGTVTLHAGLALLVASMLLAQPDVLPPTPVPVLIQAHLTPRALPIMPPLPAPAPPAPPKKPPPPARPVVQPSPIRPLVKANAVPASPLPAIAVPEAKPAPAANPAPPTAPPPAIQLAAPAPAVAAPVKTGPSIPATYATSNRRPDYPLISRRYGEQGTVMLRVYVKADGSAGEVQVKTTSGYELLDESAKAAVQGWRFNPATIDGKPIAEWYQLPIPFKLKPSQYN